MPVNGVGLIVGIDRFMSEARALTNFAGNAVAIVLIGGWTGELDKPRLHRVLRGELPYLESVPDIDAAAPGLPAAPAQVPVPVPA
jgi:aerobic C4-dicarboxylate transport protein